MTLDDYEWRPITFQGVTFPATVMGISILEPVLDITDRELGVAVAFADLLRCRKTRARGSMCPLRAEDS